MYHKKFLRKGRAKILKYKSRISCQQKPRRVTVWNCQNLQWLHITYWY